MTTMTTDKPAVRFFYEHAGYSYDPARETAEEGRWHCARELAAAEERMREEGDLFVIWQEDDIDSSYFEETDEPHALFECLLCSDCEYDEADLIRGYDPRDGIFERPGKIIGALGGIDLGEDPNPNDPYKRVVVAELYSEFEAERESMTERGDN